MIDKREGLYFRLEYSIVQLQKRDTPPVQFGNPKSKVPSQVGVTLFKTAFFPIGFSVLFILLPFPTKFYLWLRGLKKENNKNAVL
jgi:hypothetical protein